MLASALGFIIRTVRDSVLLQYCFIRTRWRQVRRTVARPQPTTREAVTRLDLQPNAYFHVYWKRINNLGEGPCVSLYVFDEEVLKFDCFGKADGHCHINLLQSLNVTRQVETRLYFREDSVEEQIERTEFELRSNCTYYLQRNLDTRIARFQLEPSRLSQVARGVKLRMFELQRLRTENNKDAVAA